MSAAVDTSAPNVRKRELAAWFGEWSPSLLVFAVLFILWEVASRSGFINPLFSSSPSQIFETGVELTRDGTLIGHAWASAQIFLIGFGMAIVFGVPIGVAIGWFDWANRAFSPLVSAFYTTPRIALMPLFIIWFGLGLGSKVALVFLSGIFPLIVNMQVAMLNLDGELKRVGVAYGANQWQLFRTIALPASVPFLLTGLRLAMGRALLGVVAAEVFGGGEGLGYLIEYAGATFRIDVVFVGVFVIAAFGIIMDRGLFAISRYVDRWRGTA